ncbi:hypothetical protein GPECTOR_13g614 [Gonium pectorale]|uniref:Ankyrin repeat domain-containing protein n=1 Tax=Gonium pectorale TaxID=33097 RepID=A0A150GMU0_GONPE|nr:hypothetical protein GPECTOR_13g614 [Gonium pectorale]|eukprot:KXZ51127.1 hypothetical protein GPECTOR_13g614 [Gonium pectorale]
MEARDLKVEAISRHGTSPLPNIWLPGLVERFASLLHPNEVICALRCVDKATAEQFRGRPEFASVRLSRPVPPHAFAARWAAPGAMRDLTLAQRKQLLRLTADTGVVANLEVALEAVGFILNKVELSALLRASAYVGHIEAVLRWLDLERRLGYTADPLSLLSVSAAAGQRALYEALICGSEVGWDLWAVEHVATALYAGRPKMADWLLKRRPEGPIGPGDSLAPLGEADCGELLFSAMKGCGLSVVMSLLQRCSGVALPERKLRCLLHEAIGSRTTDWQAKAEWAEAQLPPGFHRTSAAFGAAACHPDADLRLTWLLTRGYPTDEHVANFMLRNGNAAALELLLGRGLRPPHSATDDAARWGWLEVLKKLREYGYPLGVTVKMWLAASRDQLPVLVWAVEELGATLQDRQLSKTAAGQCGLETLAWLHHRGCPLDGAQVVQAAAKRGDLQLLQWAVQELGAPVTSLALLDAAAGVGNIELMAWLRERGCPWGGQAYSNAARAGCEAALEWLAEQGCPVPDDGGPYLVAADNNDLATLRCLARLGCRWGPTSGPGAVFESCIRPYRPLPVLRLLVELGCPVDWEACAKAAYNFPEQMREWLLAKADQMQSGERRSNMEA